MKNENNAILSEKTSLLFTPVRRRRTYYGLFLLAVLVVGLSTRRHGEYWPSLIAAYGGDTLWTLLIFLGLGFWRPRASIASNAGIALGFSFFIEVSQFYQAPWLNAIRQTTLGGLVLGFRFLWSDLVCYTFGVLLGVAAEWMGFLNSLKGRKTKEGPRGPFLTNFTSSLQQQQVLQQLNRHFNKTDTSTTKK